MAWTVIPTTDIDQDSPITQPLMTALRDNTILANAHLARNVASASASSDFTAPFDSALYDGYFFVLQNVKPTTNDVDLLIRTSTNGGGSWDAGSGYNWSVGHIPLAGTPSAGDTGASGASAMQINSDTAGLTLGNAGTEYGFSGTVFLPAPHLAANTMAHWAGVYRAQNNSPVGLTGYGERTTTTAVNGIRFIMSSGTIASGTISMYGLGAATG